ncbi:MAG: hypothetical protein EOM61_07495, partial [Bacteroidia bacterium]|nr:hypothetical protein [Bacteroidia bacterium]
EPVSAKKSKNFYSRQIPILQVLAPAMRRAQAWVFGYFDGRVLDSAVLIRFVEVVADGHGNESFYYRSGGGITINSNCEQEYREMLSKIYIPV